MAGKRKKAAGPEASSQEPAPAAGSADAVAEQADRAQPEEKPHYAGEIHSLAHGKAHLRDYGNGAGIDVFLELPHGETPAPGVTEPLKERRHGHTSMQYLGKGRWHKRLRGAGLDPAEERTDAYDRFREAVRRQKEAENGPGEGGHAR